MNHLLRGLFAGITLISLGCTPHPSEVIVGSWQVDSVYSYYNGFDLWEHEEGPDWANYEYTLDGQMKEIKFGSYRSYRYELSGDILFWVSEQNQEAGQFELLELQSDYMVQRRSKAPIFPGKGQERFEIRYFSRAPLQGAKDIFLKPGRQ